MKEKMKSDFLVIGGGIVGISVGRELQARYRGSRVLLIEKEEECGQHASGRNSGVLHAGFYYTAESLKAKLTRDGNAALTAFCEEHKIPINKCGKLVVAKDEQDIPFLDVLLSRAAHNGVKLFSVSEQEMKEIEPRAKSFGGRALFSPATSSVRPLDVLEKMKELFIRCGGEILTSARYLGRKGDAVVTTKGSFETAHVVNAAGLYADKIARDFGFSQNYSIIPFKGLYLYSEEPKNAFRTHIYPVPNLANPFLGVHLTMQVDGTAKIGPTAIPAFWREQYEGWGKFKLGEFLTILGQNALLMGSADFDFKGLALEEITKYSRSKMAFLASQLVRDIDKSKYRKWGRSGIRAQLLHLKTKKLEMDFVIEGDKSSTHILNAVSPAFTCCIPFAKLVCDRIEESAKV